MKSLLNRPLRCQASLLFAKAMSLVAIVTAFALNPCSQGFADSIDFVRDVQPIFETHCVSCHGQAKQKSGLRLDIKSEAFKGGDGYGPSIVAGSAAESPLFELVTSTDSDTRMPPDGDPPEGKGLSVSEIRILEQWIEQGAAWPPGVDKASLEDRTDHWSFKPRTPGQFSSIDAYIDTKLAEMGLAFAPEADPRTWLRRVYFDLIGLPPQPAEVAAFISDDRPDARERVVERLLGSPRYGERWAQHWLDVVRYADTHGFEVNTPRANAWPYRDYVIDAFNGDLPYDEFVRQQLAGDAFGRDAATGFLVTAAALLPGQIGKDDESKRLARQDSLAEIIINTSEAFLGLSIGCARCHDHKFDAITQRDYYSLQAFFGGVQYGERDLRSERTQAEQARLERLKNESEKLDRSLSKLFGNTKQRDTAPKLNEESFEPVKAKWVRFTIHDANLHPSLGLIEPCIDEFEVFTSGDSPRNVALASNGTKVTASGSRTSSAHKLEHINDGVFGNSHSWMSDEKGRGWVLLELPETTSINKVVWSRDREGKLSDRLPTLYTLEAGETLESMMHLSGVKSEYLADAKARIDEKRELEKRIAKASQSPKVFGGVFKQPEPTYLLSRGDPEQPLDEVAPAVPVALGSVSLALDAPEQERRRTLADWIACADNPLTARVMVNRIWQGHFGVGLVETSSDFGRSGARPTHPELLDWLAEEFICSGWSMKHMHRLIVLSKTYGQSNQVNQVAKSIDADARTLWRFPSRRLEAETIRDAMLAVSGRLSLDVDGPGFDLFGSRGGLSGFPPIESFTGDGLRRMIYSHKIRMEREAVFGAFDCPDAGQSTARRRQSTTPIQALNLFNSRFTIEESEALAKRVQQGGGDDVSDQVTTAFRMALGRDPETDELDDAANIAREHGLETVCRVLFNSNEFLFLP